MKHLSVRLLALTFTLALAACAGSKTHGPAKDSSADLAQRPLTQAEAASRAEVVSQVSYQLWVDLRNEVSFRGKNTIRFQLANQPRDLFLDFSQANLLRFTVNGKDVAPKKVYDGQILKLPRKDLHWGQSNEVVVEFEHGYSHNGNGLHQFKDSVDGNRYLYTDFEPFHAHLFFPCFDQPDLKATFQISADTPDGWQVISSTRETSQTASPGSIHWDFPVSDRFSTYLVSLHAGPYAVWQDQAGSIPLRLFARQSLAKYMDAKEWFTVTKQGLEFYGNTFSYPYPFHKYDQIVVPDFNAGAMENVAAVTFTEHLIFRSKETRDRHMRRADTILHEMAHMWFGDLVTMRWWNDLWLNESFATFMSAWAVDQATDFKGSWQAFSEEKRWALHEDQLSTTHPIEGDVPNTDAAMSSFDGITYGKGASVLKQLSFLLGESNFKSGLRAYFQAHAFQNATLQDFMSSMGTAANRNLSKWQSLWLETAGVNGLMPHWACQAGRVTSFQLEQTPDESAKILRPHRTQIGFYMREGEDLVLRAKYPVEYSAALSDVKGIVGQRCPDFVYANQDDYDYAKVALDPQSLALAKTNLAGLQDPFVREQVWHSLSQMVVDGQLSSQELLSILFAQGKGEMDSKTLASSLGLHGMLLHYLHDDVYETYRNRLENFLWQGLRATKSGSDLQLIWFGAYVDVAHSEKSLGHLENWLNGKEKVAGLKIDQDRRWDILTTLARWNHPGTREAIGAELQRDATDAGHKSAITAEVRFPEEANKQRWMNRIFRAKGEPELKVAEIRPAMETFFAREQEALVQNEPKGYFDTLRKGREEDENYVGRVARGMFPPFCKKGISSNATNFLDDNSDLPIYITKNVKNGRQENDRCVRARSLSGSVGVLEN